ncbi:hypothetical protein ES703_74251 [subsurface metagenome]
MHSKLIDILIIDDDAADRQLTELALKNSRGSLQFKWPAAWQRGWNLSNIRVLIWCCLISAFRRVEALIHLRTFAGSTHTCLLWY